MPRDFIYDPLRYDGTQMMDAKGRTSGCTAIRRDDSVENDSSKHIYVCINYFWAHKKHFSGPKERKNLLSRIFWEELRRWDISCNNDKLFGLPERCTRITTLLLWIVFIITRRSELVPPEASKNMTYGWQMHAGSSCEVSDVLSETTLKLKRSEKSYHNKRISVSTTIRSIHVFDIYW